MRRTSTIRTNGPDATASTAGDLPDGVDPLRSAVMLVSARPPAAPAAVLLRPLGYLLITVVWIVLAVLAIGVSVVLLPFAISASLDGAPLAEAPGLRGGNLVGAVIVLAVLIPPIFGAMIYVLSLATIGQVLLSATLFARSLVPAYRDERLSFTVLSSGGEALGPPGTAATGVALSLLPTRLTRWTKIAMMIGFNGWIPTSSVAVIGIPLGCAYFVAIGVWLWPVHGAAAVAGWSVAAAFLLVAIVLAWRRRQRLAGVMPAALRGTAYELSWPATRASQRPARPAKKPARNIWGV